MTIQITDSAGFERDFHFEVQKHAMHLRSEFTARQLAIYELYKKTVELPGSVIELGVRNGANFFFLARLIEIFNGAQRFDGISSRHLFGFDTFSGFSAISAKDQSDASWPDMKPGGVPADREIFFTDFERFRTDSPNADRLHVVEGDVADTLPRLLEQKPGVRFAFAFFDLDVYQATKLCLELIWDKVVPGGIIVFDEYALAEFPGESAAVDEFMAGHKQTLRSIPWCYCPSAYLIKE